MIDNTSGRARQRGVTRLTSEFDPRCTLHINDAEYEAWIEFHEETYPTVRKLLLQSAWSRGWEEDVEDDLTDDYDSNVYMGEGLWRTYLITRDGRPDIPLPRGEMPDLTLTAYGPFSGVMEAIR